MSTGIPLTPDILSQLQDHSKIIPSKRSNESVQFLLLLVIVAALLVSTLPLLLQQSNKILNTANAKQMFNPAPTPDSSLLYYINSEK